MPARMVGDWLFKKLAIRATAGFLRANRFASHRCRHSPAIDGLRRNRPARKYRSRPGRPRGVVMAVVIDNCSAQPRRAIRKRRTGRISRPAQARLDSRQGAGFARLRRDAADRASQRLAHGLRGGRLPEHRRVLGEEARHLHDHGRYLHARLRLLQRQDRVAGCARPGRARACRRGGRKTRAVACGRHVGRSRRSCRRRRGAFRGRDRGDPCALP